MLPFAGYAFLRLATLLAWMGALFLLMWGIAADRENWVQRRWRSYCSDIEQRLARMFIFFAGQRVAAGQLAVIVLACAAKLLVPVPLPMFLATVLLAVLGPDLWLRWAHRKRMVRIDEQVDGFLMALANALKSRPSIADAVVSVQVVTTLPIRQEVELSVKQMRVGSTPEQALLAMSRRVGSRKLDAAISAILVGRQVGGNVSQILETTAAAMREMARLEGVVRAKTAGGKAQLWTLAVFPFGLILAFSLISPGYFDPLSETVVGGVCTTLGFGLWGASIVSARRILRVDI
ncbi:MAG TPA: type II secretion system F family protein [Polyangiaceae bacterium]|jgi:tight adherence protein B|nr:type II secretion system F family protein [Polyangiaceae bacterium]